MLWLALPWPSAWIDSARPPLAVVDRLTLPALLFNVWFSAELSLLGLLRVGRLPPFCTLTLMLLPAAL
ncbi:MAG: hypothetical protein GAK43_01636 [Stenotrophomonas maltophilia]|nr:MAG: hypothetical protein GAK43_01636 [Stenotrophomonas maltophilia]